MLMSHSPSFSYQKLGTEICPCVIRNLYKLEHFCSVRVTRSHVIEMLLRYWLEVHVVNTDKTIVAAAGKSSSSSSAVFLV